MTKNQWIVGGCFALALALPARAFDSLNEIKASLANCRSNCRHRTLLQARLNYRLKMLQALETGADGVMRGVPGMSTGARQAMAGIASSAGSNAGAGVGGNVRAPADNSPLRGQNAMSVYVSVYGSGEINAAELRLSIEEQFRELGINVLPHTAPPGFPVFNLTIKNKASSRQARTTEYDPNKPPGQRDQSKTITVQTVAYDVSAELRRLVPGTTTANDPIRDEAIWKVDTSAEVGQLASIAVADEGLKLAIVFTDAWASVNPQRPPIAFKPRPPIVPGPPPRSNHPDIVLLHETVRPLFKGAVGSVYDVHESQREMVEKQLSDLAAAGQKVVVCQYGPQHTQSTEGFTDYSFWYPAPPAGCFEVHAIDLRSSIYEVGADFRNEVPFDGGRRRAIVPSTLQLKIIWLMVLTRNPFTMNRTVQPKLLEEETMRRFCSSPLQVLMCLLPTFACSLRAQTPVYVGVNYGLLKSTDAGATWNLLNIPLNSPFLSGTLSAQILAKDPQNPSKIYFIGRAQGTALFASPDAGATWSNAPFIGMQPTHLAVDFAGQTIYVSASTTSGGLYSVYKSTNTGASWMQLPIPTTPTTGFNSVLALFADPIVSGTVYAVEGNDFFKSTDFGSTWKQINQQPGKAPSYIDPHNPLISYDVTGGRVNSVLFKSTDGGATFTQLKIPTDNVDSVSVGAVSSTVYAVGDVAGLGETVLKSTDGGATWTALKNGLVTFGVIWADPVDASTVFVNDYISPRSFYVSTDAGAHFNPSVLPQGPPGCVPGNCSTPDALDLLFAASTPLPPAVTSVVNGASFQPGISQGSWITIKGANLSGTTRIWAAADFIGNNLPTQLDGVGVTVDGKAAYVYYISPTQLNALAPADAAVGPVQVQVTYAGQASNSVSATESTFSPAMFMFDALGQKYVAAVRVDGQYIGPTNLYPGLTAPAHAGDILQLYATGFGPTNPATTIGQTFVGAPPAANTVTATIGGVPATVQFVGLVSPGEYQFNIVAPAGLPSGDNLIVLRVGGVSTQPGAYLTVQ